MKQTRTFYYCDCCGKKLDTCDNSMDICTEVDGSNIGWSRLHVRILHRHGSHNDAKEEDAELCQKCAIKLLTDALKKVQAGVRATEGTQSSQEERWDE